LIKTRAMLKPVIALLICVALPFGLAARQASTSKSDTNSKAAKKNAETYSATTAAKTQFMRESGYRNGRPGYVVAYRKPLACGGADDISNMEWLTTAEAKAKDKADRSKACK
jgi:hypothetical protein